MPLKILHKNCVLFFLQHIRWVSGESYNTKREFFQLNVILDLVNYIIRLGGDTTPPKRIDNIDAAVFDRTKFTIQKLRHFRFVLVGIAVKVLSGKIMLEEVSV